MMNDEIEKYKVLMTRILAGEASDDDRTELDAWIKESAENLMFFEQFKSVWNYRPADTQNISIDKAAALKKIRLEIERIEKPVEQIKVAPAGIRRYLYFISGIAAMLLIFLGIYLILNKQPSPELFTLHANEPRSEGIMLADGSKIYLNRGATITYPAEFSGKERVVQMTGEAFFEIAPDTYKPFVVEMDDAIVRVLGTSFNISNRIEEAMLSVAVVSGSVALQTKGDPAHEVILAAGEKCTFYQQTNTFTKESISNLNFMAWKTRRLDFDQTGLAEVFKAIESAYQIQILTENDLSELKLTARFSDEEPADIFKTIGLLFDLDISHENGVYVVR